MGSDALRRRLLGRGRCASVAAGLCAFALGSDTNGSVRVPASFCGVWGLKPTYGRLSRAGMFPFAASLDTLGILGRTVRDLAMTYDSIAGADARDPVCWQQGATALLAPQLAAGIEGVRIARLGGYFREGWSEPNRIGVESVAEALRTRQEVELPSPELARAAAFDSSRRAKAGNCIGSGSQLRRRILIPARAIASSPGHCCPLPGMCMRNATGPGFRPRSRSSSTRWTS